MQRPLVNESICAFTLLELFISIAALVVLALLLLPAGNGNKARPEQVRCTINLREIGLAFRTWALDHNDNYPMHVSVTNGGAMELAPSGVAYLHFRVLSNELSTPKILVCPADAGRAAATNFTSDFSNQKLSYFVGLDLVQSNFNAFLSGDRNITNASGISAHVLTLTTNEAVGWTPKLHDRRGNICLADGSVQGLTMNGLRSTLAFTGLVTNRLAMP